MDKILKPTRLGIDPNSSSATKEWRHWKRTFTSYVRRYITTTTSENVDEDRLAALVSCATPEVFEYFDHCETYAEAEATLEQLYVKQPNDIFARHVLQIAKQKPNQTLEDFRCTLVKLAKDCDFKDVTAAQYKDDMIRDSFINGISSSEIRQRLLEHKTLTMKQAFDQAVTMDDAKRDNRVFLTNPTAESLSEMVNAIDIKRGGSKEIRSTNRDGFEEEEMGESSHAAVAITKNVCLFCGSYRPHDYKKCRAKSQVCRKCNEKGHYERACHLQRKPGFQTKSSKTRYEQSAAVNDVNYLCAVDSTAKRTRGLDHALVPVYVEGNRLKALLDTGSSKSYISEHLAQRFGVQRIREGFKVGMAQATNELKISSVCIVSIKLYNEEYVHVALYVMKNLCVDVLLGKDFLELHKRVVFDLGGIKNELVVSSDRETCAVTAADIMAPSLFANLKSGWKPIATKSRRFNEAEKKYISHQL